MAKKFLLAYPNPFIHLDHDGYPAGACPCDMPEHVGMTTRRWVGAELDPAATMLLEKLTEEERRYRDARQQTRFLFTFSEPTKLPVTEYYKDRLRHGEILPADADSARLGGIDFMPPAQALAQAKTDACAKWVALMGPGEKPELVDALDSAIASIGTTAAPPAPRGRAKNEVTS
jgi:hypothetical protein